MLWNVRFEIYHRQVRNCRKYAGGAKTTCKITLGGTLPTKINLQFNNSGGGKPKQVILHFEALPHVPHVVACLIMR